MPKHEHETKGSNKEIFRALHNISIPFTKEVNKRTIRQSIVVFLVFGMHKRYRQEDQKRKKRKRTRK